MHKAFLPAAEQRQHSPAQELRALSSLRAHQTKLQHALIRQRFHLHWEHHPKTINNTFNKNKMRKVDDRCGILWNMFNVNNYIIKCNLFFLHSVTVNLVSICQSTANIIRNTCLADLRIYVCQVTRNREAFITKKEIKATKLNDVSL